MAAAAFQAAFHLGPPSDPKGALAERPDSEIDFSDIPPLPESFWNNAVRNPFYRPVKQQLTVRLDADILAWLRRQGRGYQTRLNQVLRKAMIEDIKKSA